MRIETERIKRIRKEKIFPSLGNDFSLETHAASRGYRSVRKKKKEATVRCQ